MDQPYEDVWAGEYETVFILSVQSPVRVLAKAKKPGSAAD